MKRCTKGTCINKKLVNVKNKIKQSYDMNDYNKKKCLLLFKKNADEIS